MTDPAPAPTTSSALPAQATVTLGSAAKASVGGIEVDLEAIVKAVRADEAKAKADALKWYKEAIVAVGSRVFYIGVGAVAMFVVSHVL